LKEVHSLALSGHSAKFFTRIPTAQTTQHDFALIGVVKRLHRFDTVTPDHCPYRFSTFCKQKKIQCKKIEIFLFFDSNAEEVG